MKFENDILNMQKLSQSELDFVVGGTDSGENPEEELEGNNEATPVNPLPDIKIHPAAAISVVVFTIASWIYTTYRVIRGGVWSVKWCLKKFGACSGADA